MKDSLSRVQLDKFDPKLNFNREASKLKFACWYFFKSFFFLTSIPFPNSFKCALLKMFGAKVGKGLIIKPRVNIHFPWKVEIGDNVWIGEEVIVLSFEKVIIGNNVCVSQRAFLCGGNHDFRDPAMPYRNGPITLLDGCWVGASCFVGPDVVIGTDTVITAASVVTTSLGDNGIYRGNPASYVKDRFKNI